MPREFPIDHPIALETALEKIVRDLYNAAIPAIIEVIRVTYPTVDRPLIRAAAANAIASFDIEGQLEDLGSKIEQSWARQLSSLLSEDIPRVVLELQRERQAWVRETAISIRRGITGATSDSMIRHDGVMSLVEVAIATIETTEESVSQAVSSFASRASQAARSAALRARSASYRYGGIANRILQRAFGRTQYIWRTRRDGRVRPTHARLEGTRQRWDDPPVISPDGRRGHPGEDFNCRCIALPT